MNYELAKELKEAGFPQTIPTHSPYERYSADGKSVHQWQHHTGDPLEEFNDPNAIKVPTLSELIEACGIWIDLYGFKDSWHASHHTAQENKGIFGGDTPEEAVARLWLALRPEEAVTPLLDEL